MKNQSEYINLLNLFEKLLDAKLGSVDVKLSNMASEISQVNRALNGNGRSGLIERVECVENTQKNMAGKIGLIAGFFGLVVAGMVEIITRFFGKKLGV